MNQWQHSQQMMSQSISKVIKQGELRLAQAGKADAAIDAKLLMLYVLDCSSAMLLLNKDKELEQDKLEIYLDYIEKRASGVPLQHITSEQEFMGLSFYVDENVLVPRQDTETLVEKVVMLNDKYHFKTAIDIGTGSGCIGISLAHYIKDLKVTLLDISDKALEVAQRNIKSNNVETRVITLKSDVLDEYRNANAAQEARVDLIVSNPPYIAQKDIPGLMTEVKDHDPMMALTDGLDGLEFYRRISHDAKEYLNENGVLVYEIGYDQREDVIRILENEGYHDIEYIKDMQGNDRVVVGFL